MHTPANPMVISGFFAFDRTMDLDALRLTVAERMFAFPRFRSRVVHSATGPRWVDVADLDVREIVGEEELPAPGDEEDLRRFVSVAVTRPLAMDRPLWRMTLLRRPTGDVLHFLIHHAIGDGIALMKVLLSLCDGAEDESVRRTGHSGKGAGPVPKRVQDEVRALLRSGSQRDAVATLHAAKALLGDGLRLLRHPRQAGRLLHAASPWADSLAHLSLLSPDPPTPLKSRLAGAKVAAWSAPLSLADVKHAAKTHGATINDLLLASVAGALHRHLESLGQPLPPDQGLRALVPINLRPPSTAARLGNHFGLILPELPVGEVDLLARLHKTRDEMARIKNSVEPAISFALLQAIGHASDAVEEEVLRFFGSKASLVLTNVPGPRRQLSLAGAPVRDLMFWVPQAAELGLGVSLLSYAGRVHLGVIADFGVVPDPAALLREIRRELGRLGVPQVD